jgi:acyl-[acyl-carrier-protein] desaturase
VAYQRIVDELFKRDPDGTMLAFADMMKKQIVMPAHMMNDGEHHGRTSRELFADYSSVAERVGVCVPRGWLLAAARVLRASRSRLTRVLALCRYTPQDYCDIMQHLIDRWGIEKKSVTSGEAAEAQEFLVKQPERIRKLANFAKKKADAAKAKQGAVHENFSWIFGRKVEL